MKKIISVILCLSVLLSASVLAVFAEDTVISNDLEFAGGSGTEEDPYRVATPEHLNNVRNHLNAHFVQICDIDMTEATSEGGCFWNGGMGWIPIGGDSNKFNGVYDGCEYKINGLKINKLSKSTYYNYASLFAVLGSSAHIKNVNMTNGSYVVYSNLENKEYMYVGGIFGWANLSSLDNRCIVENCVNKNTISVVDESNNEQNIYIGGIGGRISYSDVINNKNFGKIEVTGIQDRLFIGGIVGGASRTKISLSRNFGELACNEYSYLYIGGISGSTFDTTPVSECYNKGDIKVGERSDENEYIGGIVGRVGYSNDSIYNCYNIGNIVSKEQDVFVGEHIGGIAGYITNNSKSDIKNCYNAGYTYGADGVGFFEKAGNLGKFNGGYYCYSVVESPINTSRIFVHNSNNLTSSEMRQKGNFVGFDFDSVWDVNADINNGMPYLRNIPTCEINLSVNSTYSTRIETMDEISGIIVVALYDNENRLLEIKTYSATEAVTATLDMINLGKYIKVMYWNNMTDIKPLCEDIVVNI